MLIIKVNNMPIIRINNIFKLKHNRINNMFKFKYGES
jgi:hypothetical protein